MNEMMQGLAGRQAMDSVKEVMQMLLDGARPEDLIANGVPEQLVAAAMEKLSQQMQAQQQPQGPVGLAGMATQGMM